MSAGYGTGSGCWPCIWMSARSVCGRPRRRSRLAMAGPKLWFGRPGSRRRRSGGGLRISVAARSSRGVCVVLARVAGGSLTPIRWCSTILTGLRMMASAAIRRGRCAPEAYARGPADRPQTAAARQADHASAGRPGSHRCSRDAGAGADRGGRQHRDPAAAGLADDYEEPGTDGAGSLTAGSPSMLWALWVATYSSRTSGPPFLSLPSVQRRELGRSPS